MTDWLEKLPFHDRLVDAGVAEYLVPAVAVFLAFVLIRFIHLLFQSEGGGSLVGRIRKMLFSPAQQAARLEKQGRFEQAAAQFRDLGLFDDAARCCRRMENAVQAGEFLEGMERYAEAEEMYEKAGSRPHLKRVWRLLGKWQTLGETLLAEGKLGLAAEAFEQGKLPLRAAETYEKAENFEKAAVLYRDGGRITQAAAAFEKAYHHQRLFQKERPELARQAALLYQEASAFEPAARMFSASDLPLEAAEAYRRAGLHSKAGEWFHRARDYARASEAYEAAGEWMQAALVRAERLEYDGRHAEAAEQYRLGDNLIKAAELFEAVGRHADAAKCFEMNGEYHAAAENYVRAGDTPRAAELFQRAGNFDRAADLFLGAGQIEKAIENLLRCDRGFDAGMLLYQLGQTGPAISALRGVAQDNDRFAEAHYLLGNLLKKSGLLQEAVEAYRLAIGGRPMILSTLDVHYQMADALEASGMKDEARRVLQQILVLKPDFRDASRRLRALT